MKPVGLISAGVLLLVLGAVAPTYARQDQHEEDAKAPKQEQAKPEKQEEAKAPKQEEAKPEKQQEAKAAPKHEPKPEEAKVAPRQEEAKPEKQQQAKAVKQPREQEQAKNNQQRPQRSAAAEQKQRSEPALRLSARGDGRIPDERFRSNFGSDHRFRIGSPTLVGGYSRFQYGGYWFGFVDPWPVGWYYTDDVYVDYVDGGYYLYNPYYPDTRVSINVVL